MGSLWFAGSSMEVFIATWSDEAVSSTFDLLDFWPFVLLPLLRFWFELASNFPMEASWDIFISSSHWAINVFWYWISKAPRRGSVLKRAILYGVREGALVAGGSSVPGSSGSRMYARWDRCLWWEIAAALRYLQARHHPEYLALCRTRMGTKRLLFNDVCKRSLIKL